MRLDEKNIELALKICKLYTTNKYSTISSILNSKELTEYNLTTYKITDMLHSAIKYNLVDDESANIIKEKAIAHSERKSGVTNFSKVRNFYENLFTERELDKKNFPNGHIKKSNNDTKVTDINLKKYEQLQLF